MKEVRDTFLGTDDFHYRNSYLKDLECNDTIRILHITGYPFKIFYERENSTKVKKIHTGINILKYRFGIVLDKEQ